MRRKVITLGLLLAAGMLGCGKQQKPRHIVILADVSGSIERKSLEQAFKAIDEVASHLQRGDRIAIIPILGDAQAEASGRIIRFEISTNRQAYDSDLRNFRTTLTKSLEAMQADAAAHPGSKTDILGSVSLAEQEFHLMPSGPRNLLLILSDFIQEDVQIDFKCDKRMANQSSAVELETSIGKAFHLGLDGVAVYLGFLRSKEYASLTPNRRLAIQTFWIKYFKSSGAHPMFANDGPGLIETLQ